MIERRRLILISFAAGALALCCASAGHAQVDEPNGASPQYGYIYPHPYGYHHSPHYIHPRYRRGHYGCGCCFNVRSGRAPNYSYGKYLFHVKYRYPELDYGIRNSPSSYYHYNNPPIIIVPAPPATPETSPQMQSPETDESTLQLLPIPSPELSERFLKLAEAAPGVVVIRASEKQAPAIDTSKRPMTGEGWDLLREGDATGAWRSFTVDAANDPHNSLPRIGYALAAAMWEDHGTSVWAMRRAIRLDPSAIVSVEPDDALIDRITKLRRASLERIGDGEAESDETAPGETASDAAASDASASDDLFMVAAMDVMLGDLYKADRALSDAIEAGDRSESAVNLQAVIDTLIRRDGVNRIAAAIGSAQ